MASPTHYHARPHREFVGRDVRIATQAQVVADPAVYRDPRHLDARSRSLLRLRTTAMRSAALGEIERLRWGGGGENPKWFLPRWDLMERPTVLARHVGRARRLIKKHQPFRSDDRQRRRDQASPRQVVRLVAFGRDKLLFFRENPRRCNARFIAESDVPTPVEATRLFNISWTVASGLVRTRGSS